MKEKKLFPMIVMAGILLVASLFSFNLITPADGTDIPSVDNGDNQQTTGSIASSTYCCEKTKEGAWCQNAKEKKCAEDYKKTPTSCESTQYCKLGTCFSTEEGRCMPNVPQQVCNKEEGGIWKAKDPEDIPQCQLGCCLMGGQASYVTKTRCKKLSSLYGLGINFRNDINSESRCIAMATAEEEGACVYKKNLQNACKRTTRSECKKMKGSNNSQAEFYEGKLCTAPELNTICAKTKKTTCVDDKDAVYYVDSCGNLANIYDSSRYNDQTYWSEIISKGESCNPNPEKGNADSSKCGNCDYYSGSTCKEYDRNKDKVKPVYGEHICRDLGCEWQEEEYQHGETWCADSKGTNASLPGSRHFRMVCYNNEVTIEPCTSFRQEICVENKINGFSSANCVPNKWQDCKNQDTMKKCENSDKRDCQWIDFKAVGGKCVPKYPPGFKFWNSGGTAKKQCSQGSVTCHVECTDPMSGDKTCESDLGCVNDKGEVKESWKEKMNNFCKSIGDCGTKNNYLGIEGWYNESDSVIEIKDSEEEN